MRIRLAEYLRFLGFTAICFQKVVNATRPGFASILRTPCLVESPRGLDCKKFSTFQKCEHPSVQILLQPQAINLDLTRPLTKFSLQKGKRKSVGAVLKRFYRLDWGVWIRTKCGRQKKLYKKSANRKHRLRQHVFTNSTQSWLLDSMVTKFWRKPKYYVDDPYNPYHKREEFPLTRKKPALQ